MTHTFGLTNIGSICYFNSLIQALAGCPRFIEYINLSGNELLINAFNGKNHLALLNELRRNHPFHGQQCANEVYISLLDFMSTILDKKIIDNLFGLKYHTKIYCKTCEKLSNDKNTLFTYFAYIPSQITYIESDVSNDSNDPNDQIKSYTSSSTSNLLKYIFDGYDKLSDFNCDRGHSTTYKVNIVKTLPYILVVTLGKYYSKTLIPFSNIIQFKSNQYQLVSIIDHYGGQDSGHYVCRSVRDDKKILFNDSYLTESIQLNPTESAYMLFYKLL